MKTKKLLLPGIFLAVTIVISIVAMFIVNYMTKPAITEGEFPFSITYAYKGETNTLSGVLECEFSGSCTIHGEHRRYWNQEVIYDNPENLEIPYIIDQNDEMMTSLAVHENMYAGYFMGDPLYKDYYKQHDSEGPAPYVEYYDYKNDISLNEENRDEILAAIDFKILDFTYAEPIENSFSFAGISFEADNMFIFVAISLVFLLLCVIFVRKDKGYTYALLDKAGILINFLVGLVALPFMSLICFFYNIDGCGTETTGQIAYNIPPIAIICLALSVVLRRKGYRKTGFYIQFTGVVLFLLLLAVEAILML